MKTLLFALAVVAVVTVSGCASFDASSTSSSASLASGLRPAQGSFPSQVVGP